MQPLTHTSLIKLVATAVNVFFYLHFFVFVFLLIFNHFDPFSEAVMILRGKVFIRPEVWKPEPVESIGIFENLSMLYYKNGFIRFDYTNFSDALTWNNVRYFVADNLTKALWLCITFQMRNIFLWIAKGDSFRIENVKRIRLIAGSLFFIPIVQFLALRWFVPIVRSEVRLDGYEIYSYQEFDLNMLGIAILILVLGEVFKYGFELQNQSDLTI